MFRHSGKKVFKVVNEKILFKLIFYLRKLIFLNFACYQVDKVGPAKEILNYFLKFV